MSTHLRVVDGSDDGDVPQGPFTGTPRSPRPGQPDDAALSDRIDRALRSRETAVPDAAVVAARIEELLAARPSRATARRGTKIVVAGVVTSTLAVVGAGAAAAADPYSNVARVVENAVQAMGVDWSPLPDGFTRVQWEAFSTSGYSAADVDRLGELWSTELIETKAVIGQKILDGEPLPAPTPDPAFPPPNDPDTLAAAAFWGAGYSGDDLQAIARLWQTDDTWEAKVSAGEKILAGEALPFPPSSPSTGPTSTP